MKIILLLSICVAFLLGVLLGITGFAQRVLNFVAEIIVPFVAVLVGVGVFWYVVLSFISPAKPLDPTMIAPTPIESFLDKASKRLQFLEWQATIQKNAAVDCCRIERTEVNLKQAALAANAFFQAQSFELPIVRNPLSEGVCQALNILDKSTDTLTVETFLQQNQSSVEFREWLTGTAKNKSLPALQPAEVLRAELTFMLFKAMQTPALHLDIYIEGHADDNRAPWQKPLRKAIDVELFNDRVPGMLYASLAVPDKQTYKSQYNNDDLPNLRAEFVKNHMVLPLMAVCFQEKQNAIKVGVLDGKLHQVKHDQSKRKATFFLDFYH